MKEKLTPYYPERELNAIITIILGFMSGKDRSFILARPGHEISSYNWFKVNKICNDLKNMVPVQYITGETEFYGIKLRVTRHTLIPRQETEELVDKIIKENTNISPLSILDIGTGTGCIAISLASGLGHARLTASDNSEEALLTAKLNAKNMGLQVEFINDDILSADSGKYGEYDIVVSNPPYICRSEKAAMSSNVIDYEPHTALFVPDDDPLIYYRAVLDLCCSVLKPRGRVYFEINENKSPEMKVLLENYGYSSIKVIKDINGKPRIIKGIKA